MIFRRRKPSDDEPEEASVDEAPVVNAASADETGENGSTGDGDDFDAAALDAQDWRTDGPWDVSEVDLDAADDDEAPRIDLGSVLITGFDGAELRLQVSEETQQIVSVMLISPDSALELGAYAAPRSGGLWAELRDEIVEGATEAGGSASLVEGPFGVEVRRLLPVTAPDGEQGYQPSRMWVAEGPRWLLRGIVYGQAALEDGLEPPVEQLLTAFRSVIVRRGDQAMAPGDLLPLVMPAGLVADEPDENAADEN